MRNKTHRGELPAVRWEQELRYFREQVLAAVEDVGAGEEEITED